MILAILVKSHLNIISTKHQSYLSSCIGEDDFQSFLYSHMQKNDPAPGGHVFLDIIMILAILLKGHLNIISAKYHANLA